MKRIALVGNPNVGKSTIFNVLTGMHQHTGNWPGKTVAQMIGFFSFQEEEYELVDLPGTYSLISHSEEESVTRDFLCLKEYDGVIVVCDSLCLERNLNLVMQILDITPHVLVCVNLLDEARKKKVQIDLKELERLLKVPVVGTEARKKKGISNLEKRLPEMMQKKEGFQTHYPDKIEEKVKKVEKQLEKVSDKIPSRFFALRLLEEDSFFQKEIENHFQINLSNISVEKLTEKDTLMQVEMKEAENIAKKVITLENESFQEKEKKIDLLLTNKKTGIPIMLLLTMFIFWLTITGANYPSELLFNFFAGLETPILEGLSYLSCPSWLSSLLVGGIYKTLTWVISVMLPPMAIFFPLFTLLEDLGVLPRIAFNLDRCFQKCKACGKQALCMMMGFGCNAAGVVGIRIIDSKRERMIAILTNAFVPCNGRFPTMILLISMFFVGTSKFSSIWEVLILTGIILFGILMTFWISWLLSKTLLKGVPSSFTLELPPYRKPQIIKVIIRSVFDKTLHILGRAVIVTIPAGILIWILANIKVGNLSILAHFNQFLDSFGKLIGLDGVILTAFLLGFPANEIVLPIILMSYLNLGTITDYTSISELQRLLVDHGWTILTALNVILFSLLHFPCSTTCLTIKKETGSWKWMILAILLPTICGILVCFTTNLIFKLFTRLV